MTHSGYRVERHSPERAHVTVSWQLPIPEDLMTYKIEQIEGIAPQFGRLLDSSGVQSVTELRNREPENVVILLYRLNDEKKLTRALPSLKTVAKWIRRARELEPLVRLRNVSRAEPMRLRRLRAAPRTDRAVDVRSKSLPYARARHRARTIPDGRGRYAFRGTRNVIMHTSLYATACSLENATSAFDPSGICMPT